MGPREVMLAGVVPAVVGLVVLVFAQALLGRGNGAERGRGHGWVVPGLVVLLVGCGVVLGSWVWQSRVEIWTDSVTHRFPAMALAAVVAGLVVAVTPLKSRAWAGALVAVLGGWFVAWAVLGPLNERYIGETERWVWIAAVGLIAGAQSWAIDSGTRRLDGWRGPAVLWLLVGLLGLGVTSGFANGPLVLWPVAGVMFAAAAVGVFHPGVNLVRGCGPVFAVVISGAVAFGHWYGDVERWVMFSLLMAGPIGLGLAALPGLRERPWLRLVVAGGVSLGLVGAQAGMAVPGLIEASGGGGDEYYDY